MVSLSSPLLLLGIGNYLMGDEGVGVHLAQRWGERPPALPEGCPVVDVLDGGTGGFHLLEYFERYGTVILVDATLDGGAAGTIRLIEPRFATDFPPAMSTHEIGLKDMMSALQFLGRVPKLYLFVVSIESIQQQGMDLTAPVAAVLDVLTQEIVGLIGEHLCEQSGVSLPVL